MKRWIIRSFFIGLLLLCVGGWGWSYAGGRTIFLWGPRTWVVTMESGEVAFITEKTPVRQPWKLVITRIDGYFTQWDRDADIHSHGFRMQYHGLFLMGVPFWFPTLISAAVLWLVWRKTRAKVNPATAFPVELTKPSEKS